MVEQTMIRFGIVLTYNCNKSCPGCNRYLDFVEWPDSDIRLEGLEEGYRRVQEAGIKIQKVRVTGGEPLLHPEFLEAMKLIQRTWNKDYGGRTCVFSNGSVKFPKPKGWRYNVSKTDSKRPIWYKPCTISPADLGFKISKKAGTNCSIQKGCGRLFDAFGFAPCVLAAPIGRLLGIDPYSNKPVLKGNPDICKHCPYSLRRRKMFELFTLANKNLLNYPTKTFQNAIAKAKKDGVIKFTRFEDR